MNVLPAPKVEFAGDQVQRVTFTFPVWKSSKNDVVIAAGRYRKGDKSTRHKAALAMQAEAIASSVSRGTPLFGKDDDVRLELIHVIENDTVRIVVERMGAPLKAKRGVTGRRRDVQNLLDTLADALEGPIFHNDNQVAHAIARRAVR